MSWMMPCCRPINSFISPRLNWSIPLCFSVYTLRPSSCSLPSLPGWWAPSSSCSEWTCSASSTSREPLPDHHSRLLLSHNRNWFPPFHTALQKYKDILILDWFFGWRFIVHNLMFELSIWLDRIKQIKHTCLHLNGSSDLNMSDDSINN